MIEKQEAQKRFLRVSKAGVIRNQPNKRSTLETDVLPIAFGCNNRQRVKYSVINGTKEMIRVEWTMQAIYRLDYSIEANENHSSP